MHKHKIRLPLKYKKEDYIQNRVRNGYIQTTMYMQQARLKRILNCKYLGTQINKNYGYSISFSEANKEILYAYSETSTEKVNNVEKLSAKHGTLIWKWDGLLE